MNGQKLEAAGSGRIALPRLFSGSYLLCLNGFRGFQDQLNLRKQVALVFCLKGVCEVNRVSSLQVFPFAMVSAGSFRVVSST